MASVDSSSESSTLRFPAAGGIDVKSRQVTVVVGQGNSVDSFYAHQALLTRHSKFFAGAFRNGWKEAEGIVRLPDEQPEHFEIFTRFLYSGRIFSCKEGDNESRTSDRESGRLARCWVLGDKLGSTTFKDAICDALCEKMKAEKRFPLALHAIIYPFSATKAPIKRLLLDVAVWRWSLEDLKGSVMHESWNEYFKDPAIREREISEQERKGPPPFQIPECKYHEHAENPCYKTMF